ncbi:hypothetical protein K439DRAFT_1625141 [Ramaria rubella]|nr:hypothetical protein K439DRAFT_1625141 [Ramaria rubella]
MMLHIHAREYVWGGGGILLATTSLLLLLCSALSPLMFSSIAFSNSASTCDTACVWVVVGVSGTSERWVPPGVHWGLWIVVWNPVRLQVVEVAWGVARWRRRHRGLWIVVWNPVRLQVVEMAWGVARRQHGGGGMRPGVYGGCTVAVSTAWGVRVRRDERVRPEAMWGTYSCGRVDAALWHAWGGK